MHVRRVALAACLLVVGYATPLMAQPVHSVARRWNEELLESIRHDFARPTVHARNLWHTSIAMWDAWAAYDNVANTFLLGKTVGGFHSTFVPFPKPVDVASARDEAISYACYRLLTHRFKDSPGRVGALARFNALMATLGYDTGFTSTDYTTGSPAALGNYIARTLIDFGFQDGSNEQGGYSNLHYQPVNPPFSPSDPGDPVLLDMNHWQPLTLDFIDQSGNHIPVSTPPFLGPEWGEVTAFALRDDDRNIYHRDDYDWWVFHDPGPPPYIDTLATGGISEEYKWSFALNSIWASHLDATDGVMWDVSPGGIGNLPSLPTSIPEYRTFYDLFDGGDHSPGYAMNPKTGMPYTPQIVPRGDYARVLAEFWADGPASETPPGHWFTILNYVNDHPLFVKRMGGVGPVLDPLEWDVKAYFTMAGAVHDAAVAAWGVKGWYDYIRPVSAIRGMCERGQSSDPAKPRYNPAGITLIPGYIEMVEAGDPLAGAGNENVGRIKLWTWKGHDYITDPRTDTAGVGWILADNWWPYQRPTFITPPFAGYVSGHSTFSRAAAEVMTLLTGDPYFPGGMGEFFAPRNEFLVFEDGPSVDVTLQWARYVDASDQCSLSRIWGGIHPPADDIPGRRMGLVIGPDAFYLAEKYFGGEMAEAVPRPQAQVHVFPNPIALSNVLTVEFARPATRATMKLYSVSGQLVHSQSVTPDQNQRFAQMRVGDVKPGVYFLHVDGDAWEATDRVVIVD